MRSPGQFWCRPGPALCAFGCDALFETGYLTVGPDGVIIATERAVDGALGERLKELAGKECLAFNPGSLAYFDWHRQKNSFVD
jgi:hypothetical protein